jgi:hypothetical protein
MGQNCPTWQHRNKLAQHLRRSHVVDVVLEFAAPGARRGVSASQPWADRVFAAMRQLWSLKWDNQGGVLAPGAQGAAHGSPHAPGAPVWGVPAAAFARCCSAPHRASAPFLGVHRGPGRGGGRPAAAARGVVLGATHCAPHPVHAPAGGRAHHHAACRGLAHGVPGGPVCHGCGPAHVCSNPVQIRHTAAANFDFLDTRDDAREVGEGEQGTPTGDSRQPGGRGPPLVGP